MKQLVSNCRIKAKHGNSEHKKAKAVNRNVFASISHNKCKDVLLNKKCLRQMNETSKDHTMILQVVLIYFLVRTAFLSNKFVLIFSLVKTAFLASKLF